MGKERRRKMTSKTHAALGLLTAIATIKYAPQADIYTTVSACVIGSLIPDLDTKKSCPSKVFPIVSLVVDKFTKHRGFTHVTFPFLLVIAYFYFHSYACLMMGIGAMSHLIIDEVTLKVGITLESVGEEWIYKILWTSNVMLLLHILATKFNL